MFKIGIGPSSSHTMGPWQAARRFVRELGEELSRVSRITVDLYGSLAKTGIGHGTDIAVQAGLSGLDPTTVDKRSLDDCLQRIAETRVLQMPGHSVRFDPKQDIVFHRDIQLPQHPNALRFSAGLDDGQNRESLFFSIGGGFITKEGEGADESSTPLPFPVDTANDLLRHCQGNSLRICEVVMLNELAWRTEAGVRDGLAAIRETMLDCIHRGCRTGGVLPGGLNVQRRAASTARQLLGMDCPPKREAWLEAISRQQQNFHHVLDWVSCFALAVNEENAAFGRVVTAPTNGAAGVIPAVLLYYECFANAPPGAFVPFLMTAAEIGSIFKKGATISAAMGGCQAEIGVSSAMAAAALAEGLGGSPRHAMMAAEVAMEHHLGMTCDPVGGLVQIPCIERNAMGAIKAITAARIALNRDPDDARVSLGAVVRTMWETAQDMNAKYKETSDGGLAVQVAVNVSEC